MLFNFHSPLFLLEKRIQGPKENGCDKGHYYPGSRKERGERLVEQLFEKLLEAFLIEDDNLVGLNVDQLFAFQNRNLTGYCFSGGA